MKQQLQFTRSPFQTFLLAIGIFLISNLSVTAQRYFELRDVAFNNAVMAGDNFDGQTYHYHSDGRFNAQWKFELVQDSFYTITDRKHGKMLGAGAVFDNSQTYQYDPSNNDYVQWCLVDVDGRGVWFYLKNKKYNRFLSAEPAWNSDLRLFDTAGIVNKPILWWRLYENMGTGSLPKDVKGKEVKPSTSVVFNTNTNPASVIEMYGLPNTLCGDNLGKQVYNTPPNDLAFMSSFPLSQYGALDQSRETGKDNLVSIYINSFHRLNHPNNYVDLIDPTDSNWPGEKERDSLKMLLYGNTGYNGVLYFTHYPLNTVSKDYHLPFGTASLLSRFFIQEQNFSNGIPLNNNYIQIPCQVSGIVDHMVDSIGYTVEPQIPYLVLHDPPGDGSYSSFLENKTICRQLEDTYTIDESNNIHGGVKIGAKGTIGFIVTVDYEFSTTLSGGETEGALSTTTVAQQNCINTSSNFTTSQLEPVGSGGGDIFIGYGTDLAYGKYKTVEFDFDSCKSDVTERLIYAPTGIPRRFTYTEDGIRDEIASLRLIVEDSMANDIRSISNADNQIKVWEQVLALNAGNKANASELIDQISFFAGSDDNSSTTITVMNTASIAVEHWIEKKVGMETVLEIAGSGGSFGYEYSTQKRYGQTYASTEEISNMVSYDFTDDDAGDRFDVDVLRDPMFGTPVFRLRNSSKTSCPYEGGIQRDQPLIKIDGQSGDHILLENVPGEVATIKLDLCNESNESRTYLVGLGGQNPGGATVKLGGNIISANPYAVPIGPNTCAEDYVLTIQRNPGIDAYPNLEIEMYPECDGSISSSVFVSVYFGTTSAVQEQSPVTLLSVFPNPTSGELTADFNLEEAADVRFELYDMVGSRVVIAAEENYVSGPHRKEMNVDQVPSGIYQLAIKTNQSVISRKVIVQH